MAKKFLCLVSFIFLWLKVVYCLEQKHLRDLRKFRIQGVVSRFAVSRSEVEIILKNATADCDLHLSLPEPVEDETLYDTSLFGELVVTHTVIYDYTLSSLSCNMKEKVSVSYSLVSVTLPVVADRLQAIILCLARFTDSDKDVFFPFSTNSNDIIYIDEIDEMANGTITLRLGNDVLVMNTQHNYTCRGNHCHNVGKDFDKISGKLIRNTNYPLPFDWGCDVLGGEVNFCDILKHNENDLKEAGSNVCTEKTTTYHSKRYPATSGILKITGFFRNVLPFLSAPIESFEAEWVDRENEAGIVFPCFSV